MVDSTFQKLDLPDRSSRLQIRRRRAARMFEPVEVSQQAMERNRLINALGDQRLTDSYALLRARLLRRLRQRNHNLLGVTSPSGSDGKTLTAVNLALSIAAAEPRPVLLVDADLRRPSVAQLFGLQPRAGLGEYLTGRAGIDDLVLRLPIGNVHLLPGNVGGRAVPEMLASETMEGLVSDLKQQYGEGFVIVDLPPVLVGGDVLSLAPQLDAVLLVAADRRTHEEALRKTLWLLEEVNVVGTVLNFAEQLISSDDYYVKP